MAKSKSGTPNLFEHMQKPINKNELKPKKAEEEIVKGPDIQQEPVVSHEKEPEIAKPVEPVVNKPEIEEEKPDISPSQKKVSAKKDNSNKSTSKMGRPCVRGKGYSRYAVDLPAEVAEKVEVALLAYNGSIRTYITKLVQKDFEENQNVYNMIKDMKNSL